MVAYPLLEARFSFGIMGLEVEFELGASWLAGLGMRSDAREAESVGVGSEECAWVVVSPGGGAKL